MTEQVHPGSFRDPSGFLFHEEGRLYRQVNHEYESDYDLLINSGLYEALTDKGLLIPHKEVAPDSSRSNDAYQIIEPELIPFISYPYEWCFSQLKDAALTTISIQQEALSYGMSLKDASAYNIQFLRGNPILIDTLSFEKYNKGKPWVAYRQFCQHFLAPLALSANTDIRLNQLLRAYIDGIPLDLAAELLPLHTYFRFSLLSHIHFHAKSQRRYADRNIVTEGRSLSLNAMRGLLDGLKTAVKKLKWKPQGTEWSDYYDDTNYTEAALARKKDLVSRYLDISKPGTVWDLGANVGTFSRIAADKGIPVISFDVDPAAVEKNYLISRKSSETNILPLLLDLTNPSPGIGWENRERMSLLERGPTDAVLALAIIHHLAIANNLPLGKLAEFFGGICKTLIIEFVPKDDSQVQRLLSTREDIFPHYSQEAFEMEFGRHFRIESSKKINESERLLYLMPKK